MSVTPTIAPEVSDGVNISTDLPQALPFVSVEFWTSTEVLTNLTLAGIFLSIILLHQFFKWLIQTFKPRVSITPDESELAEQTKIEDAILLQRFSRFQKRFVLVYGIAFSVDMLGAPYVYYMYSDYHHLDEKTILYLLRVAFLSTAVSSGFTSLLVDSFGRRLGVALCLLAYILRYMLVAFTSQFVLSQMFYGLGAPLLYAVPVAWMVDQHRILGFPDSLLQDTYLKLTITNSVLSIVVTQCVAWLRPYTGLATILVIASSAAVIGIILLFLLWEENVGSSSVGADNGGGPVRLILHSLTQIFSRFQIFAIGLAYVMMDCSFWILVTSWTPTIKPLNADAIFPGFMIACAMGSYIVFIVTNGVDVHSSAPTKAAALEDDQAAEVTTMMTPEESERDWLRATDMKVAEELEGEQQQQRARQVSSEFKGSIMSVFYQGIPLRLTVILYQLSAAYLFFALSSYLSLYSSLSCFILLEFCWGCHWTAFGNLKAQVFPSQGRLVINSFFDILGGILNYVVLGEVEWGGSRRIFSIALIYCSIAFSLTTLAYICSIVKQLRRRYWQPDNLSVAVSSAVDGEQLALDLPPQDPSP